MERVTIMLRLTLGSAELLKQARRADPQEVESAERAHHKLREALDPFEDEPA